MGNALLYVKFTLVNLINFTLSCTYWFTCLHIQFLNFFLELFVVSLIVFIVTSIAISSEKVAVTVSLSCVRSFEYSTYNTSPRILPWGTQTEIFLKSE